MWRACVSCKLPTQSLLGLTNLVPLVRLSTIVVLETFSFGWRKDADTGNRPLGSVQTTPLHLSPGIAGSVERSVRQVLRCSG